MAQRSGGTDNTRKSSENSRKRGERTGQGHPVAGRKPANAQVKRTGRTGPQGGPNKNDPERENAQSDTSLRDEIVVICALLISVLLVLSYFGVCGAFGDIVNMIVFGLFGVFGYIFPFLLFAITLIVSVNKHNRSVIKKALFFVGLIICVLSLTEILFGYNDKLGFFDYFTHSGLDYNGTLPTCGGLIGAVLCCILCPFTGKVAAFIIILVLAVILFLLIAGRAIFTPLTKKGIEHHREHREQERLRRETGDFAEGDGIRSRRERRAREISMSIEEAEQIVKEAHEKQEKKRGFIDMLLEEGINRNYNPSETETANETQDYADDAYDGRIDEPEDEPVAEPEEDFVKSELRRKFEGRNGEDISGIDRSKGQILGRRGTNRHCMVDDGFETALGRLPESREEEYTASDFEEVGMYDKSGFAASKDSSVISIFPEDDSDGGEPEYIHLWDNETGESGNMSVPGMRANIGETGIMGGDTAKSEETGVTGDTAKSGGTGVTGGDAVKNGKTNEFDSDKPKVIPYVFPPISLLTKNKAASTNGDKKELRETVEKLQSTFRSFGVGVTVTDATCGPTVTRYELLPDQGVKVKTITALADDVKLALAAAEIRIEAPIPGKAAVGIEVPNAVTSPVLLRDLIDSPEFRDATSPLTFAVGKDISGKTICFDIASMPHMLVAGATGSGKSVCINSLIMSVIYKAKPTEVRMIMIDPKRVELIGYNGIPHLLWPVVTDVKKANAVLDWAIHEMDDRYQRFADSGVNNLASYNRVIEEKYYEDGNEGECPDRLPQILIIVDELNDLMMTANSKEVEASICRLTQLARACGIHVVLATQRPSVNVITGTIKANIPSRIAFSVSSLVDSRTIIDQAGAEKLLGKGDMLFYPQGYPKPVRLQGAYVSDREVAEVVTFVKSKVKEIKYNEALGKHIENAGNVQSDNASGDATGADDDRDELYTDCGRYIIETQKASIGNLQRKFKIGFNRAARIMDNLSEDEVVGPDEGTKSRKILMTMSQFNDFVNGGTEGRNDSDKSDGEIGDDDFETF